MNNETINQITTVAKLNYINKLKGKYWNIMSRELSKIIPNEFKEIWSQNASIIKEALKKVSHDRRAVIFNDNGIIRVAAHVNWLLDKNFPDDGDKSVMIEYMSGVGENRHLNTKYLLPSEQGKTWIIIYNNEKNKYGEPIPDISHLNIDDRFNLDVLVEYGANILLLSIGAKGIMEIMKNSKNKNITEETIAEALRTGVFVNEAALATEGSDRYSKVAVGGKLADGGNLNYLEYSKAADFKIHQENLRTMEQNFFADKGLKEFEKIGTFNAHGEEIQQMREDKVGGLFEKIIHIEENIVKLILFLTGKIIDFKFDIDLLNKQTQLPKQESIQQQGE